MNIKTFLLSSFTVLVTSLFAQKKMYNITQFGAVADAKTLNTLAIQKAIDTCAARGGGRVMVPKGTFLSGSIRLKTGVELHITEGGILLGSTLHKDYKNDNPDGWYGFILANNQQNIAITGKGIIDIQGFRGEPAVCRCNDESQTPSR